MLFYSGNAMLIIRILRGFLPKTYRKLLKDFWILSEYYGLRNSIKQRRPVNQEGKAIPWYTYPAIEYLSSLDFSKCSVLEFGSGGSSIWWEGKAKSVLAVEHKKEWADTLQKNASEKLRIVFAGNESEYLNAGSGRKFDVIVIDGVWRQKCVEMIPSLLNEDGIVILDNSDWYPKAAKDLREQYNLLQVDFHGFGPINDYTWTTSVFFSRSFDCRSNTDRLPHYSVGAITQVESGQEI
jgi:hypothetical protein